MFRARYPNSRRMRKVRRRTSCNRPQNITNAAGPEEANSGHPKTEISRTGTQNTVQKKTTYMMEKDYPRQEEMTDAILFAAKVDKDTLYFHQAMQ